MLIKDIRIEIEMWMEDNIDWQKRRKGFIATTTALALALAIWLIYDLQEIENCWSLIPYTILRASNEFFARSSRNNTTFQTRQ